MVLVFDSDFPAVRVELEMLFLRRGLKSSPHLKGGAPLARTRWVWYA